jgi:hypothetical protein
VQRRNINKKLNRQGGSTLSIKSSGEMDSYYSSLSSTPSEEHHPQQKFLTNYNQYNAATSCCIMEGMVAVVTELVNAYLEQEEVQNLLPLPFQKKNQELSQRKLDNWYRPLDPVPTEEETLQMINVRRKKCRRRKKQHNFSTTP